MNWRQESPFRAPAGPRPPRRGSYGQSSGRSGLPDRKALRRSAGSHRGFSRASRNTSSRTARLTFGRPGRRPGYVQRRATRRRCHASSVSGVTKSERQRALGSCRLVAAKNARSAGRNLGRETCRRSTASSWRSTTISSSLKSESENTAARAQSPARTSRTRTTPARDSPLVDRASEPTSSPRPNARADGTIEFWHPTRWSQSPLTPFADRGFDGFRRSRDGAPSHQNNGGPEAPVVRGSIVAFD
jgi:hypothetical protein